MKPQIITYFSILIVEEDLPFARELEHLVREIGYQVKGQVDNPEDALKVILMELPDLILISKPIKDSQLGVELVNHIKDQQIPIIFINPMHENRAMNNNVAYLSKPVSKFSMQAAIELAMSNLKSVLSNIQERKVLINEECLYFKKKGIFYKIIIADIVYIKADGNQSIIHTQDHSFIHFISLRVLVDLLSLYGFMKVHRSYLINRNRATSIDIENRQIYCSGMKIPFSRRMKGEIMKSFHTV